VRDEPVRSPNSANVAELSKRENLSDPHRGWKGSRVVSGDEPSHACAFFLNQFAKANQRTTRFPMVEPQNIREIRERAGLSKTEAAALAKCAPPTWRLYELDPKSISAEKRPGCDEAVAIMRATLSRHAVR